MDKKIQIEKITIENNKILDDQTIKKKISFLYEENLFFLNNKKIISKLQELDFIDSIKIKKIYPNQIKVKIYEKQPIAIIQNKKEKKYSSYEQSYLLLRMSYMLYLFYFPFRIVKPVGTKRRKKRGKLKID